MSKYKHLTLLQRLTSPDFTIKHNPLECIEELDFLFDPINEIRDHQSRYLEYDYENDLKTWIR